MPETKLKLSDLFKMADDILTKEEFLEAFKNLMGIVLKAETALSKKNGETLVNLNRLFGELEKKVKSVADSETSKAIKELRGLVGKSLRDQEVGMNLVRDKLRGMRDGKDADEKKIIDEVIKRLPKVKELEADNAEKIRDKLEKLAGDERFDWKSIRGLENAIKDSKAPPGLAIFGGNRPLKIQEGTTVKTKIARLLKFTGATITQDADGTTNIAIAGGTPVSEEAPTDSGDQINFTIANTPSTNTFRLFRGGARQQATVDFTLTGTDLVLTTALVSGEILICDYNW